MTKLTKAVRDVAATVVKDGALDAAGVIQPAVWDTDKSALKEAVRQSLVLLKDKNFAVVTKRGLTQHGETFKLAVRAGGMARGEDKDLAWLDDNVHGIWLGVLTMDGPGAAAKLDYNGVPASLIPVLGGADFTTVKVSVSGSAEVEKDIAGALDMLGLTDKMRLWSWPATWRACRARWRTPPPGPTAACRPTGSRRRTLGRSGACRR